MKIVILEAETLGFDIDLSAFHQLGDVTIYNRTLYEETAERVQDAEIIVVNKIPMDAVSLKGADRLKLIALTATGTNNIDAGYVGEHGIAVANVKGYSTASVVQHTFAMLFYLYEKLAFYDAYVKTGEYAKSPIFSFFGNTFHELSGKVWGIIGLGEIGKGVAETAECFGCKVVYYSTSGRNQTSEYRRMELKELLQCSDIVSVHAPLNPATRYLIGKQEFSWMKPSAVFINAGRGPIIRSDALCEALENGTIAAAALDVLEHEPILPEDPLLRIQDSTKLLITPHIAWASVESRIRCADEVCKNIEAFMRGEKRNIVYPESR